VLFRSALNQGEAELGCVVAAGEEWLERVRQPLGRDAVSDTGEGIPAERLPHAFEPFFACRDDAPHLGLALVQRVVHGHGGTVNVRSDGGVGAEFTVRFPVRHA